MDKELKTAVDQFNFALYKIILLSQNRNSGEGISDLTLPVRSLKAAWDKYHARVMLLLPNAS